MNFKPELVEKILAGEKTQTRRAISDNPRSPWWREECSLKVNRAYALCPGRGKNQVGKVVVTDVAQKFLGRMHYQDALAEGFGSVEEFRAYWERMHGSYDPNQIVWKVSFFLMPTEDAALWEGATPSDESGTTP